MEIDLVYLWFDGSDPEWAARKRAFTGKEPDDTEINCKARWEQSEELLFSLRSAEKFAPWIRKIFIVTDGQTPEWLNTWNPRVQIVNQKEILPPEANPCFNSVVLEYYLYRIPGLSEHFLYANDDMFFAAHVQPSYFFAPDGYPIVRLIPKPMGKLRMVLKRLRGTKTGQYRRSVHFSAKQIKRITGKYYSAVPHHNIDAYTRSVNQRITEQIFAKEIATMVPHHLRTEGDLQRVAIHYWALATGRAHAQYVRSKSDSTFMKVHKADWDSTIDKFAPRLFCLNDSQRVSDDDRLRIRPFLESLYPEPSSFEKKSMQHEIEAKRTAGI